MLLLAFFTLGVTTVTNLISDTYHLNNIIHDAWGLSTASMLRRRPNKQNYTLEDALSAIDIYEDCISLLVYDPKEDVFNFIYPGEQQHCTYHEAKRLRTIRKALSYSLRALHPERFHSNAPEFALVVASGDYPLYKYDDDECFRNQHERSQCVSKDFPPILQFGSVFKNPVVPSTIAMPMPEREHLGCFHQYLQQKKVCRYFNEQLPFGEKDQQWNDLIPQVVWRGSDYLFLKRVLLALRRPIFETDIAPMIQSNASDHDKKVAAIEAMGNIYQELVPRWKAILLTAKAELEAEEETPDQLPWANLKFATDTSVSSVDRFMKYGIPAIGGKMTLDELSKYKYHLDIGGCGGK